MRIIFLLSVVFFYTYQVQAQCQSLQSDTICSSHGACKQDLCHCEYTWMGDDCSIPISALAQTKLYQFFRWGGLVWYLSLTIVLGICVWNVRQGKELRRLCIHYRPNWDHGGGREFDPQQLTLVFVFIHCLCCALEYATDPLSIRDQRQIPTFIQWMLWYIDLSMLLASCYTMVRFWVKVRAALSPITLRTLKCFDWTAFILFTITVACWLGRALFYLGADSSEAGRKYSSISEWCSYIGLIFGGFYSLIIIVFATRYGMILLQYLYGNKELDQKAARSITKLTLLLLAMMSACVLYLLATLIQDAMATQQQLLQFTIISRCCLSIFVLVVPFAIGTVNKDRNSRSHRRAPTHGGGSRDPHPQKADSKMHHYSRTEKNTTPVLHPQSSKKHSLSDVVERRSQKLSTIYLPEPLMPNGSGGSSVDRSAGSIDSNHIDTNRGVHGNVVVMAVHENGASDASAGESSIELINSTTEGSQDAIMPHPQEDSSRTASFRADLAAPIVNVNTSPQTDVV